MPQHPELATISPLDDSPEARRETAEKLVAGVLSEVEFEDFVRVVVSAFGATHIQHQQCLEAAHFVGKDSETIRRWLNGVTTPKARDFWPLAFVVMLQLLPVATQHQVMGAITGMVRE